MKRFRIFDDVSAYYSELFATFIQSVTDGEDIQIELMSYGGDVFSGLAIAELIIEAHQRGIKTNVVVYGVAASAAAIIALAASHVEMTDVGSMMLHGVYCEGNTKDKDVQTGIDRANAACLAIIRRRSPKYTMAELVSGDHWYSAQEAFELGLIDQIRSVDEVGQNATLMNMLSGTFDCYSVLGGKHMMKMKNELDETQVLESVEESSVDNSEEVNEAVDEVEEVSDDLKSIIVDGMTAILERLERIEEKLARDDVALVASDDEPESHDDIMSAKIRTMYNKIGNVCKPCARKTKDDTNAQKDMKAAAERVKKVFPDLSKFYAD